MHGIQGGPVPFAVVMGAFENSMSIGMAGDLGSIPKSLQAGPRLCLACDPTLMHAAHGLVSAGAIGSSIDLNLGWIAPIAQKLSFLFGGDPSR